MAHVVTQIRSSWLSRSRVMPWPPPALISRLMHPGAVPISPLTHSNLEPGHPQQRTVAAGHCRTPLTRAGLALYTPIGQPVPAAQSFFGVCSFISLNVQRAASFVCKRLLAFAPPLFRLRAQAYPRWRAVGWLIQGVKLTNTECRRECKSRRKIRFFFVFCFLFLLYLLYLLYFCILYFSGCIYLYLLLWNTGASNYCFLMLVRQISDWPNMSI